MSIASLQVGAFTAATAAAIQQALAGQANYYVDGRYGFDGNDGLTPSSAFRTFTPLTSLLVQVRQNQQFSGRIVIGLSGVVSQQWTTPLGVNDVAIVGYANTPRQATTGGVANGAGATWLSPSSVVNTLPLIRVQGQGWTLGNIYFNNQATTNGCIQPYTTGDPPLAADGAHLLIDGCILTGAAYGVYASGGTNFVTIANSTLFGFSGAGDAAIAQTVGAGIGTLLKWKIVNCDIYGNASNIVMPFNQGNVLGSRISNGTAANISLVGGTAPNFVVGNAFNITAADFDPAGGTTGVTGDVWSNTLSDAIETGLPAN